jgi:hypothetical protein
MAEVLSIGYVQVLRGFLRLRQALQIGLSPSQRTFLARHSLQAEVIFERFMVEHLLPLENH